MGNTLPEQIREIHLEYKSYAPPESVMSNTMPDSAKIQVNDKNAQSISVVYNCSRFYAEQISSLPLRIVVEDSTGLQTNVENHPFYSTLRQPAEYMTRNSYFEKAIYHLVNWGNHFARIRRDGNLMPNRFELLHPAKLMDYEKRDGILYYIFYDDDDDIGKTVSIPYFDCIHVALPGDHKLLGTSPMKKGMGDFRHSLHIRRYSDGFFYMGGKPNNVAIAAKPLTPEEARKHQQHMNETYLKGGTLALGDQWKEFKNLSFPPNEAQMLETGRWKVEEICRWYNLDPTIVGDFTHGTMQNMDTSWRMMTRKSLMPVSEKIEAEYSLKSFSPRQYAQGYRLSFNYNKLLKGSPLERAEYNNKGVGMGWLTRNEVRAAEGLPPVAEGDRPLVQQGFVFDDMLEEVNQTNGNTQQPAPDTDS